MAKDPLDRLRKRSAERDWKKLQERYHSESDKNATPSTPHSPGGTLEPMDPVTAQPQSVKTSSAPTTLELPPSTPSAGPKTAATSAVDPLFSEFVAREHTTTTQPVPVETPEVFMEPKSVSQRDSIPVMTASVATQTGRNNLFVPTIRTPETDPNQLLKITEISPFSSYEPDPEVRENDPLRNICFDDCPGCEPRDVAYQCPPVLFSEGGTLERVFSETDYQWTASNLMYNPLYFQDVALERYGHDHHPLIQPAISVGKFAGQLIGMPYQLAMHPVCDEEYALGYYRPGEPTPRLIYQVPLNAKAGVVTAGVYTGLFFLIP